MNCWKVIRITIFLCWLDTSLAGPLGAVTDPRISRNSSKYEQVSWYTASQKSTVPNHYTPDAPKHEERHNHQQQSVSVLESVSELATEEISANSSDNSRYSKEFLACGKFMVEKEHFTILPNGSVYIPFYFTIFNETDYFIGDDGNLWICKNILHTFAVTEVKFSPHLSNVSLAGAAISTICITLCIVLFLTFKEIRNLPSYSLLFLCISLLIAYICLYIPYAQEEDSDCTVVTIIKAYSFLASFFWINAMSYDVFRSIRLATSKFRSTRDGPVFKRLAMYSTYAWGLPLLIITTGLLLVKSNYIDIKYKFLIDNDSCWFLYRQALLIYFALPLFILLSMNVLFFIFSFRMVVGGLMNTADNKADLKLRFFICLRLATIMGLMWIFGVLATATEATWLWYLHALFNALQGMFIFFSFALSQRVRAILRKAFQKKKSPLPFVIAPVPRNTTRF